MALPSFSVEEAKDADMVGVFNWEVAPDCGQVNMQHEILFCSDFSHVLFCSVLFCSVLFCQGFQ